MADWTDESKAELIKAYVEQEPTPDTSTEIVASLAEDFDTTVNGARMILIKGGVYVKKTPATAAAKTAAGGAKKESKAESLERLAKIISEQGGTVDDTVVSKLTGKAAAYFADVIAKIVGVEDEED